MLERDEDQWWFRRNAAIKMPAAQLMLTTNSGYVVINPLIALLFKSKNPRAKDNMDFDNILPALNAESRLWLQQALSTIDKQHIWLEQL